MIKYFSILHLIKNYSSGTVLKGASDIYIDHKRDILII